MEARNVVEITINGRRYRLSGTESNEYMQKAADHVNHMYMRLKEIPGFTRKSQDYQTLMMYLNLADEYLKHSGWTEEKQVAADTKAEETIYQLKMELIEARKKAEAAAAEKKAETEVLQGQLQIQIAENARLRDRVSDQEKKLIEADRAAESFKTEILVTKRKLSEYIKNFSQADKLLKEKTQAERELKVMQNDYERKLEQLRKEKEEQLLNAQKEAEEQLDRERREAEEKLENLRKEAQEQLVKEREEAASALKKVYEEADEHLGNARVETAKALNAWQEMMLEEEKKQQDEKVQSEMEAMRREIEALKQEKQRLNEEIEVYISMIEESDISKQEAANE